MSTAPLDRIAGYLRRSVAPPQSDADLLARCAARDEAAFAALVRRHGPIVLRVCRRVLGNSPDADDAFQATMFVLWRDAERVRRGPAVGAWLCGVAHRIACRARLDEGRRKRREGHAARAADAVSLPPDLSWREACGALHEELDHLPDRYRLPLMLCYLEGKSRDEAARLLGWSLGAVRGRLARGRKELRRRLIRRGIDLSAGLLAALIGEEASAAAIPTALFRAAITAAGGAPSAAVAILVQGTRMAARTKLAVVAVALALVTGGLGVGLFVTKGATPADPPATQPAIPAAQVKPEETVTFRGRVLDPAGKPVPGARLFTYGKAVGAPLSDGRLAVAQRSVAGAEGRFRFSAPRIPLDRPGTQTELLPILAVAEGFGLSWVKLPRPDEELTVRLDADQPIVVRVVDSEGRLVPGATVRVRELARFNSGRIDHFLAGWQANWRDALFADFDIGIDNPPDSLVRVTGPDREGRFRISGAGAERRVILDIQGPGQAQGMPFVITRAGFDFDPINRAARERAHQLNQPPQLHGPILDYVAPPAKPISGVVHDGISGKAVPGVQVISNFNYKFDASATTDAAGRFHLDGIPKEKDYSLFFRPPAGSPLLTRSILLTDSAGLEPLAADVKLVRGIMLSGRVIDRGTGRGARANISFYALPDNPYVGKTEFNPDGPRHCQFGGWADADGRFRFPIVPGPGVLTAQASGLEEVINNEAVDPFLPADLDEQERKRTGVQVRGDRDYWVAAADGNNHPIRANIIKWFSSAEGTDPAPLEFFVERGRTKTVRIEDPDGRPLPGAIVAGMTATWPITFTLPAAECKLYALEPRRPRTVVFYHAERKLVGVLRVRGDEPGPLTLRLLPASGVVTGRVTDADGQPIAGAEVYHYYPEDESAQELFRYLTARGGLTLRTKTDADGRFRFKNVLPDLRLDLGFSKGTSLAGPKGNLWFGPYRVAGGKTLDLGDIPTKPRGE